MNSNFMMFRIKSLVIIFYTFFINTTAYSNDEIKQFSILCEGSIQETTNFKVKNEGYYFDEFIISIDLKSLNNRTDIDKFGQIEITYKNNPEIKMELINHSEYIMRASSHPKEASMVKTYLEETHLDYNMFFNKESNIISIYDYTPMTWNESLEYFQGMYKLSLASGMMTQETIYGYKEDPSSPHAIREADITTRCEGTSQIVDYISQENFKNEEPFFVGNDPNELVSVASGSGFFINKDGNIITNDHVVDGCQVMKLIVDGKEYEATVVANDKTNDIALLKVDYKNNLYFRISEEDVERSENIKAIGYGFGKNYSSDVKVTAGIVNSLSGYNDNYSEFQMDAAIQSGNSGGPVINDEGDLVGMSVSALNSAAVYEDTGTMPQNVNDAIKASTLKQFLDSNNTEYHLSKKSWFSFGGSSTSSINEKIDNAAVYLSCYMTYAEIEASMNEKAMFENIE